jgi:putative nucleotidyltransferase with HDIG domain
LPQVALATTAVVVLPVVVVWLLIGEGLISSPWLCVGLALALSLAASIAGSAYWKRRDGHGDLLFSELLVWGWLYRLRTERRLTAAVELLGLAGPPTTDGPLERTEQALRQLAASLEAQDPYTAGHSRRVALHAAMIARRMGLPRRGIAKVRTAAAIHDIGKLRIPSDVLNKPGPLTEDEFELVKRHAVDGAEIVSSLGDPEITAMVRHHHERFDGDGYPSGLVGERIPEGARIIAVADTFDALTSLRPYRVAIRHKKALQIIGEVSGSQLDPVAVRAFLKCYTGKRAVLLASLLATSPQRALAFLGVPRQTWISLGSAATVATPAALAAAAALAFGGTGGLHAPPRELRASTPSSLQATAPNTTGVSARRPRRTSGTHPRAQTAARSTPLIPHSVLGVRVSRLVRLKAPGSARRARGGAGGSGRHSTQGGGLNRGGASPIGTGGLSVGSPTFVVTPPVLTGTGTPAGSGATGTRPPIGGGGGAGAAAGGAGAPGGGSGGPAPGGGGGGAAPGGGAGTPGGGGPPGGGPGSPAGGGSAGGGPAGGGAGGGGNGPGGHPGPGVPHSKQDCWDGGYLNFAFSNQGLCIAFVEHEGR